MEDFNNAEVAVNAQSESAGGAAAATSKMPFKNFFMFPLGTVGRDFLYQLWNGYLLTYIIFTKNLSTTQFLMGRRSAGISSMTEISRSP